MQSSSHRFNSRLSNRDPELRIRSLNLGGANTLIKASPPSPHLQPPQPAPLVSVSRLNLVAKSKAEILGLQELHLKTMPHVNSAIDTLFRHGWNAISGSLPPPVGRWAGVMTAVSTHFFSSHHLLRHLTKPVASSSHEHGSIHIYISHIRYHFQPSPSSTSTANMRLQTAQTNFASSPQLSNNTHPQTHQQTS